LKEEIIEIVEEILDAETNYIPMNERQQIISEIIDETIGFGPINRLINNF
jgi:pilus assembly protein CpaF